ncbi:MAG: Efflux ABC transporter, permease protein, partial [uncultured Solirubrobacterales bacterium]
ERRARRPSTARTLRRRWPSRRARAHRASAAGERALGLPDLRLARDAQDQARARAAPRRDADARALPADVHLPVRWRARRVHEPVPPVPAAGDAGPVGAVHRRLLGSDAQHRRHQGRGRPLPVPPGLEAGPAGRRGARRLGALRARRHGRGRPWTRDGIQAPGRGRRGARGDGAGGRVRHRARLGLHDRGDADAHAQRGHELRLHGAVPADLPEQHLRRPGDVAGVARGVRRHQPGLPPGDRGPRTDGGNGHRRTDRTRAGLDGGADRRVCAAHRAAVPPEGV